MDICHSKQRTVWVYLKQGCTDPSLQVAVAAKICAVTPDICGYLVCISLHVTLSGALNFEVAVKIFGKFVHIWIHSSINGVTI